jgi:hypothetical protein
MKSLPFQLSAALSLLLCSCGSTYTAGNPDSMADEINRRAHKRTVGVFIDSMDFWHANEQAAVDLRIGRDSASWVDSETLELVTIRRDRLAGVRFTDHLQGIFDGLLVGAATGGAVGLVVGIGAAGQPDKSGYAAAAPVVVPLFMGLVCALPGGIFGGIVGSSDDYELPRPARDSTWTHR